MKLLKNKLFKVWFSYLKLFLILSLSIIAIFGGIQFYSSYNLLKQTALNNNDNTLLLFKESQDALLDQIETSMDGVFTNNLFLHYMDYYYDKNNAMMINVADQLDSIVNANKNIASVCIYYREYGYTLSSDLGPAPVYSYHDQDFLSTLDDLNIQYQYSTQRTTTYDGSTKQVITLVRTLPVYYTTKMPMAYVVINISTDHINNVISQMNTQKDTHVLVFDRDGNTIVGSLPKLEKDKILNDITILETIGHDTLLIQGRQMLVSHIKSSENGWNYIYAVPTENAFGGISKLQTNLLLLTAVVLCASILLSVFFSKRVFEPIRHISDTLEDVSGAEQSAAIYTKDKLVGKIDSVIIRNKQLEGVNLKYELSIHEKAFMGIIKDTSNAEEKSEFYTLLDIEGHPDSRMIIFVTNAGFTGDDDLSGHVSKVLLPIPMELIMAITVSKNETVALVRYGKDLPETDMIRGAYAFLNSVGECPKAVVGISWQFTKGEQITNAYLQAKEALESRIVSINQTVLCYKQPSGNAYPDYPIRIENNILKAVKNRDIMKTQASMDEFEKSILAISPPASLVKSFYLQLYCTSQRIIYNLYNSDANKVNCNHLDLLAMDSISDMSKYMMHIYICAINGINEIQQPESSGYLRDICCYIDKNLNQDLSATRLSELFGISGSTIRNMFRDELGITTKEYIDAQKINHAKQLLSDNSLKVQDIANKLGFYYSQSFIAFFVSTVGMTPGEYRDWLIRENL